MKTGKGRISKKKSGNREYSSVWLYIPSRISKDSAFPFKDKEEVIIELKGGRLEIRKIYDLHVITEAFGIEDATIPKIIEDKALLNKNLPFLYFREKIYSYYEVNQISNRIANGILKFNKKLEVKNPKIALIFPNCPESLFCWFAVAKTGCVLVPISYLFKSDLLEFVLKNSKTEILIIDYQYLNNIEEISDRLTQIKKIIIRNAPKGFNFNNRYIDFQEILSDNVKNPSMDIKSFHPLEILYTSGTTGKPKGVLFRNYFTLSGISVGRELEDLGFNHTPHKIYCPLPLFQGFPRYYVIIPALYYNASIIIAEKFNVETFWKDIDYYKPNGFCYYGAFLSALVNQPPTNIDRNHSVKYALGAGALKKVWETFERRFGIQIIESWSLVEATGLTINKIGSKGGKLGSVGKPVRGFEVKIIDLDGNELPPGRDNIGEICSRMRLPFELEYYNLELENPSKIEEDRWLHSGDFGYKDREGYVYFLGRKSDMIHRNGEIFFAGDIEIVANSHPLIVESAAFEVLNDNLSEKELKLCAVIKKKASITYEEFYNYLKQNLAYFMVPRYLEFKEELPKNANEFIQKFILRKEWDNKSLRKNAYDVKAKLS